MFTYDLILKNGKLVIPNHGIIEADIAIKGEKIASISMNILGSAKHTIDANGKYIFPGLIDPHVHIGLHLPFYQDLATESKAAAAGGVTTMISTLAALDRLKDFEQPDLPTGGQRQGALRYSQILPQIEKGVQNISHVDFCLRLILGCREHIDEVELCYRHFGIKSFKVFTAYKDRSDVTGLDDGMIFYLLSLIAKIDPPPIPQVHCEDHEISKIASEEVKKRGMHGLSAWNAARPNLAEEAAIAKMCLIARRVKSPIYIVHVSTAEGVETIEQEQRRGTKVIAETCVHYLLLTDDKAGVSGKVMPPIRKKVDVDALWEGIRKGVITCVGTDHVSRDSDKQNGGDIWTAFAAWPSMEVMLPALITEASNREIPVMKIAEICSLNCAKTFGLFPRKGSLAVGMDADMVIVDQAKAKIVESRKFHSIGKYCPYDGMELFGWPEITILRGKIIFDKGNFSYPTGYYIHADKSWRL